MVDAVHRPRCRQCSRYPRRPLGYQMNRRERAPSVMRRCSKVPRGPGRERVARSPLAATLDDRRLPSGGRVPTMSRLSGWSWSRARLSQTLHLDRSDGGRSVRVSVTSLIRVELRANAASGDREPGGQPLVRWTAVCSSDESVVGSLSGDLGPDGSSRATFRAASLGTAHLEARNEPQQRSGSRPLRAPTQVWRVTVVVSDSP